jgi:F0F1-type ATP synthase delta subunit
VVIPFIISEVPLSNDELTKISNFVTAKYNEWNNHRFENELIIKSFSVSDFTKAFNSFSKRWLFHSLYLAVTKFDHLHLASEVPLSNDELTKISNFVTAKYNEWNNHRFHYFDYQNEYQSYLACLL